MMILANATMQGQNTKILLNDDWHMKAATPNSNHQLKDEWYDVKVPALVHTTLMEKGIVPNLFYRDNETKYQWLEREDWVFEKIVEIDKATLQNQHIELNFKGLDTYADVFLNGELILKADNAFRSWRVDVKKHLREGKNYLRIFFFAAVKMDEISKELNGYALPGIPTNERVFSRKPQFHYGWDWGPRFVNCGIWRDVELFIWNDYTIREMNVRQLQLSKEKAILQTELMIEADIEKEIELTLNIDSQEISKKFSLKKGNSLLKFEDIAIKNPRLWWSRDIGEPNLYDVIIKSEKDTLSQRIGLRTIELVREKDKKGETFFFRLNGVPVFAKGANYIPLSIFQDKIGDKDYEKMIQNAADANMNMLRVWGGGIYENEKFYQLCDEKGIMVWQDFMFACAMYPGGKDFLQNVENEAIENIKQLRKHPCIALWCGNNEINEAWNNWGWKEMLLLHPKRSAKIWSDYEKIFKKLLPKAVQTYANGINYWESSPSYSRYHEKCDVMGDSHYWGVWHDEEPFEQYAKRVPRFMSEYGFQSFPEWNTIKSFTEEADRGLETPIMTVHQKHPRGNTLMRKYMAREYQVPDKFEDFTYVSQIVQAEGIRKGIEAHRRAMPYCMGSLYWQLNDVWQVASWSSIDGLGNWKALHYSAKEAFAPLLLSPINNAGTCQVYVVSDYLNAFENVALSIKTIDFQGKVVFEENFNISSIPANQSALIWQKKISQLLNGANENTVFARFELKQGNKILVSRNYFFDLPKNLNLSKPTIKTDVEKVGNRYKLTLSSDRLAKNIFLQTNAKGHWSENYFDLFPNETKEVWFDWESGSFDEGLSYKNLVDACMYNKKY